MLDLQNHESIVCNTEFENPRIFYVKSKRQASKALKLTLHQSWLTEFFQSMSLLPQKQFYLFPTQGIFRNEIYYAHAGENTTAKQVHTYN